MRWCREQLIFHNISFRFVFGLFLGGPESRSAAAGLAWSPPPPPPTDEWNPGVPGVAVSPGLSRNPSSGPGGGGPGLSGMYRDVLSDRPGVCGGTEKWPAMASMCGTLASAKRTWNHILSTETPPPPPSLSPPWSRHHSAFDSLQTDNLLNSHGECPARLSSVM